MTELNVTLSTYFIIETKITHKRISKFPLYRKLTKLTTAFEKLGFECQNKYDD